MFRKLLFYYISAALPPFILKGLSALKLSLLNSFPPDDIKLRNVNQIFKSILHEIPEISSPIRRYGERTIHTYETAHSEITIIRKKIKQQIKLFNIYKKCKTKKRIIIKRNLSLQKIIKEAKTTMTAKKSRKQL